MIVFEKGEWLPYAPCGMPYYVKGVVDELDDLVAVTPKEFTKSGASTCTPAQRSPTSIANRNS